MSKKAIFDHNKLKATIKDRDGIDISLSTTAKEFNISQSTLIKRTTGSGSDLMCFLLDVCNRHKVSINDIITVIEE